MTGHGEKAKRYLDSLEAARINGSWNELPELLRKVSKHAQSRKVLIQTATADHDVALESVKSEDGNSSIGILRKTLDGNTDSPSEDVLQARASLAWAAWVGDSTDKSILRSLSLEEITSAFDAHGRKGGNTWTQICLIKLAYIQGCTLLKEGEQDAASQIFDIAITWIDLNVNSVIATPQLSYWCEQLLAQRALTTEKKGPASSEAIKAFGLWSRLSEKTQDKSPTIYANRKDTHVVRFSVLKRYYSFLSNGLQTPQVHSEGIAFRQRQIKELRIVESAYETELLRTQKFPKANESNTLIEEWVEQVIKNWTVLCGPNWSDNDLGEGGRNAVTRNVLDILYRAASKTFQSTLILRRLFQVHKSLAEFDLAYRCLDTYIDLIERGRTRSIKSTKPDPNQDSDETVLLTIAEGITGLCSFGYQDEARKAFSLSKKLEDWLFQLQPDTLPNPNVYAATNIERTTDTRSSKPISSNGSELSQRAIGIAKAHWALWTPFSESRSELQADALRNLELAARSSEAELESIYAYALLLAETREINSAIICVKRVLLRNSNEGGHTRSSSLERKMLAFWHLLALLLSAREEFETAARSCTAAFEQISFSKILNREVHESKNTLTEKIAATNNISLVNDLECDELQRSIELQISHVALIELLDGPEMALRGSNDLLSLYARLFARFDVTSDPKTRQRNLEPPKSSAGTTKSFRGSIFSRKKIIDPSIAPASATTVGTARQTGVLPNMRPTTQASQAPQIQVTDENERSHAGKHKGFRNSLDQHSLSPRKHVGKKLVRNHSKSRDSHTSGRDSTIEQSINSPGQKSVAQQEQPIVTNGTRTGNLNIAEKHDTDPDVKQPINEIPHNVASHHHIPPPSGHDEQPPKQDVRLPTVHAQTSSTSPIPRFPKAAAQKHALMVLNKIWLVIAQLYRRAHMFEDAREACDEASKVASNIEALVSASSSSSTAQTLADPGWGSGGKSSDEVWADVFCEKAEISLAIIHWSEEEGQPQSVDSLREAVDLLEQCLMYFPNHTSGIITLSNLLLDYYEKKVDLGKKVDDGKPHKQLTSRPQLLRADSFPETSNGNITPAHDPLQLPSAQTPADEDLRKTPENLNRIAARDRAYGLLSILTKQGYGWDNSEAWYALARAHELGGEIERAKSILWWCVELEDTRPIRHWRHLGCTGYVL